jgi:hypothetical protein
MKEPGGAGGAGPARHLNSSFPISEWPRLRLSTSSHTPPLDPQRAQRTISR